MRHVTFALIAACYSAATILAAADVPTFGGAGELLRATDLTEITRLAGAELLAVEAHRGQVLPETWHVLAYSRPSSERIGVRQGRIVELESRVQDDVAQRWRVRARKGRYAQVAVSGKSFSHRIASGDLDRPFKVIGAFSEQELLELLTYVRSSPRKPPIPDDPDGTSHVELDEVYGHLPVVQLVRVNRNTVEVWLADNFYSGEHVVLHYRDRRWHIGEISFYLA